MKAVLFIASGGAIGAVLRYYISSIAHHWLGGGFAYGTLTVNVLGCFFIGVLVHLIEASTISEDARLFLGVGCLGALTTFSTFGLESMEYVHLGYWNKAFMNVALNLLLGLPGVWLGVTCAKLLVPVIGN